MKKIIKRDLFNISKRLKKIDKNFYIVFNKLKRQFEIYNKAQKTIAYVTPFLNKVIVTKAYKTSPKFASKIFKEIMEQNKQISNSTQQAIMEQNLERFKSYINYANKKNADINFFDTNKTKWI